MCVRNARVRTAVAVEGDAHSGPELKRSHARRTGGELTAG